MPRNMTGFSTIYQASKVICRMAGRFGTARFGEQTSPEFKAAVDALVIACHAFEALDNYPGQWETVLPDGPEDVPSGLP